MKIADHIEMEKYLVRREPRKILEEKVRKELKLPTKTKVSGSKILDWINYNSKIGGTNTQPITAEEKQVAAAVEAEQFIAGASKEQVRALEDRLSNARAFVSKPKAKKAKWRYTSWSDQLKDAIPEPKKKFKKIVEKPKSKVQELLEFEDFLDVLDPIWWEDEQEDIYDRYEKEKPKPAKTSSAPSIDESNATYFENLFFDYREKGGSLNFNEFKRMLLKDSDLDSKRPGIRSILLA